VNPNRILTLDDCLVFQRKYFEETTKHLDEDGWTWLTTKSGACLARRSPLPQFFFGEVRAVYNL